ncbi:hypothetical protein M406DRAFT_39337 [Cryphonectria parasitica EP155]|uniref:U6 small nuclear RNA (adenine-(43)-N(6))-methyltransferase n=1 Tax=Cryphonectria parasitica (strain ATCC 38755 / EP155) TaxID=660469 RepID=A0A9P5CR74_CRYP1|nr:uncharacterized protein M406DRAFT_39337 [Cryphonectria parasitica EP155]KAF3767237.1 hypothetical protein M406DRAFT_39337 [Cryphonectria parasitica EP155]
MSSTSRGDFYFRNLYAKEPDFRQLARQDADFRAILKPNDQLDFTDPAAVPNRHNYILWLKQLLDSSSYNEPGGKLSGLDIGTGASCIYPLLGCAQRPWSFIATDIDADNLKHAIKNVALNSFEDRIRIVSRKPEDLLIPLEELNLSHIDFVMTNPPFYQSEAEMLKSAAKKSRPPHSACTGAPVEMVCDGGEVAFVSRILEESLVLKDRVQWYTSMFGMVSSLEVMVEKVRERGINNYAVMEFLQGNKTRRWALAWSFGPMRPCQKAGRGLKATPWRRILPAIVDAEISRFPSGDGVGAKGDALSTLVGGLDLISWQWDREMLRGVGRARENVWSRAWRRKRKREEAEAGPSVKSKEEPSETWIFGFSVSITVNMSEAILECRWREGHDESIFTSFCGFLKTRLQAQVPKKT